MFNLSLPENLRMFVQILDPENKRQIKDKKTAMRFLAEITKSNQSRMDMDTLTVSLPRLAF